MKKIVKQKTGFTLIEMLVVISVIAIVLAISLPNFIGARERARDAKRKVELGELKKALRLYYNDYQQYPAGSGTTINGCGETGLLACPVCTISEFSAGGADGCTTIYMKRFPGEFDYTLRGQDDFLLKVTLDNKSDSEIANSQARCGFPTPTPGEYHICAD